MTAQTEAAQRLYDAFAARDSEAILASLHPDFVGEVSAGMPLGVGGHHEGPEAMLHVWAQVFAHYEMSVEAEELLPSGANRVVAIGHYRGTERQSNHRVEAAFAHVLAIDDDRIASLRQITDTASWTA
ncbi:MAG: nuclear transport factor 2 family protein [Solirubrobacterales bacterium]|nr:nuclear transport factor 2 family protein [Solirubrobacterales bacterium]